MSSKFHAFAYEEVPQNSIVEKRKRTTIVCSDDEDDETKRSPAPLHTSISGDFSEAVISKSSVLVPVADRENALPSKLQESLERMEAQARGTSGEGAWLQTRTADSMSMAEKRQNIKIAKKERTSRSGAPSSGTLLLQQTRAAANERNFFRFLYRGYHG